MRTSAIDPSTYTSIDHARLEAERLFPRAWLFAAHLSQLAHPSGVVPLRIGKDPILLVREGDAVRAFHDVCLHRGAQISRGAGPCTRLRCGYHGWEYGLNGALLSAPLAGATQQSPQLATLACEVRHGAVWIAMEPERTIDVWLAPLEALLTSSPLQRAHLTHGHRIDVPCNWKVSCDVHNEAYHLTTLHPELKGLVDLDKVEVKAHGLHTHFRIPISSPSGPRVKHQLYLFPNVQMNWMEGEDAVEIYRHWPHARDPAQAYFEELRLGHRALPMPPVIETFAYGTRSFGPITDADLAMLPHLQSGLSSRGAGPLRLHRLELPIAHMHAGIAEFMEER